MRFLRGSRCRRVDGVDGVGAASREADECGVVFPALGSFPVVVGAGVVQGGER